MPPSWSVARFFIPVLVALFCHSFALAAPEVTVAALESAIAARRARVEEFRFIRDTAKRLGFRAWLFGGTAAGFAHYVKWDLQREAGDSSYQPDRFDYDYTNIYRSTQDLDLVVDGTPSQAEALESALRERYPHAEGSKSLWEVRLLTEPRGDKQPLLEREAVGRTHDRTIDFLNQHTDSNSTGMIELSDSSEPVVRDLRDWRSRQPVFLKDVARGELHYYFSNLHETTSRYLAGKNPPILSVIRYLTKAFQYELTISPAVEKRLAELIEAFNPNGAETASPYVREWIERNGKKLFLNAVSVEYAWDTLEKLGLRQKLIEVKNNPGTVGSLAWWMSKKPLRSFPVGTGAGRTAAELGLKALAHETSDFLAYEAITRAHTGLPNVFISRKDAPGESAAHGDGFYMRAGREGARGTGFTVRAEIDPNAREGTDFTFVSKNCVVVLNRRAIRLYPESMSMGPGDYFEWLSSQKSFEASDKGVIEKLERRIRAKLKALSPKTVEEIRKIVLKSIHETEREGKRLNEVLLRQWYAFSDATSSVPVDALLLSSGALWKSPRLARQVLSSRDPSSLSESMQDLQSLLAGLKNLPSPDFEIEVIQKRLKLECWMRHPGARKMMEAFLEDQVLVFALLDAVFSQPYWASVPEGPELMKKLIVESLTHETSQVRFAMKVLSQAHWGEHEEGGQLLKLYLEHHERQTPYVLGNVLSREAWAKRSDAADLLSTAVGKRDYSECWDFREGILANPLWSSHPLVAENLERIIRKGFSHRWIVGGVLFQDYWATHERGLQLLELVIRGAADWEKFMQNDFDLFEKPLWRNHPKLRAALDGQRPTFARLKKLFSSGFTFLKPCVSQIAGLGGAR